MILKVIQVDYIQICFIDYPRLNQMSDFQVFGFEIFANKCFCLILVAFLAEVFCKRQNKHSMFNQIVRIFGIAYMRMSKAYTTLISTNTLNESICLSVFFLFFNFFGRIFLLERTDRQTQTQTDRNVVKCNRTEYCGEQYKVSFDKIRFSSPSK